MSASLRLSNGRIYLRIRISSDLWIQYFTCSSTGVSIIVTLVSCRAGVRPASSLQGVEERSGREERIIIFAGVERGTYRTSEGMLMFFASWDHILISVLITKPASSTGTRRLLTGTHGVASSAGVTSST